MAQERSFHGRVMDLETPMQDAKSMVSLLHRQLDDHFMNSHEELTRNPNYWHLSQNDVSDLVFTANMLGRFIRQTIAEWEAALEAARCERSE